MNVFSQIADTVRRTSGMVTLNREIKSEFPALPGVPGEGKSRNPAVMIIQDRPGSGYMQGFFAPRRASKMYRQMLERDGIDLSDIYVTSALKTKPGVKASSQRLEALLWRSFLEREIQLVKPKAVWLVGRAAREMWQGSRESRGYGHKNVSDKKKKSGQLQISA